MTAKYYVVKFGRTFAGHSYAGPTYSRAGVEYSPYWGSRDEAQYVANKLAEYNPVGFEVVEIL